MSCPHVLPTHSGFPARWNDLFVCLHRGQLFFSTLLGMLGDLMSACLAWRESEKSSLPSPDSSRNALLSLAPHRDEEPAFSLERH